MIRFTRSGAVETTTRDKQSLADLAVPAARQQIGQYRVIAKLGEGGMGEVYRARDAKLGRDVALKLLPAAVAHEKQALARLTREARTLASLNHPNIAAIYGLEESDGQRALVMELVEGATLTGRIQRPAGESAKPVPTEEVLTFGRQIAEALEYAHERGVIHRDLKPANVKITPEGTVKVLDFGLAKALHDQDSMTPSSLADSPTLSATVTQAGVILGTAAYMPPEQAEGKQADRRADIWAFGCVLYEMLAGRKAFEGKTISEVIAAVILADPDWAALPETTPPSIRRLIRRCLVKDPRQRLHDIGDARIAIEETISGADAEPTASGSRIPESKRTFLRRTLPWALGLIAILFAATAAWFALRPRLDERVLQFPVAAPENMEIPVGGELSISPDGRYLAFIARAGEGKPTRLWLRPLDSLTTQQIPDTEDAAWPFWSPDSQWIGFRANGKLKKVAVSGGTPQILCDAHGPGATWNRDGIILFSNGGILYRVSATGGTPTLVYASDGSRQDDSYYVPQFLPDGRHFIVLVGTSAPGKNFVGAGSLDSNTVLRLMPTSSNAFYAPPGYLFYLDQGTLMAHPFSAKELRFTGPAVPVAHDVGNPWGYGYFFVSPGTLAYQTVPPTRNTQMTWFNRAGQKGLTVGQPEVYSNPALSYDGTKLAVGMGDSPKANIWVHDLKRGTASRLTSNATYDCNPVWSPDGSQVFFSSDSGGPWDIYQKAADGLGSTRPVFQSGDQKKALDDLSADGRYAIYDTATTVSSAQVWVLPLFGDRKPFPYVQGNFGAGSAKSSPNGRYLAYDSNETGRTEIYIQTFPEHSGKWQVSVSGGVQPMWRRDGKELFYLTPDQKLMAVDVNPASSAFQVGIPRQLFQAHLVPGMTQWRNVYVPAPDGQKFLMIVPASESKPEPITVIVNWTALLRRSGSK
jgi:serine/threonine protein kinase/Tol biopolymer transport system component